MNFETHLENKESYKFKEVTSITGDKPYVLRFWESEFEQINPSLSENGQKVYSAKDVESVHKIKKLLFESKLSIPEAKLELEQQLLIAQNAINENIVDSELKEAESLVQPEETKVTNVTSHSSSIELMRNALKEDLQEKTEVLKSVSSFNDSDVLNLVQAKKKLSVVLSKVNGIIEKNNWN